MFCVCRQLERQGQEEEHHWYRPPETPEGRLPQIQVWAFYFFRCHFSHCNSVSALTCFIGSVKGFLILVMQAIEISTHNLFKKTSKTCSKPVSSKWFLFPPWVQFCYQGSLLTHLPYRWLYDLHVTCRFMLHINSRCVSVKTRDVFEGVGFIILINIWDHSSKYLLQPEHGWGSKLLWYLRRTAVYSEVKN